MAVNPAIAMGFRGIELQDPLAQYSRVMAIQGAQQQNALAQRQMEQVEREVEATNALNRAYAEAYNPKTGDVDINRLRTSLASGGFGSKLPAIEKQLGEVETQRLAHQKTKGEALDAALKRSRGFLETLNPDAPGAAEAYMAWHEANHKDPIIGPALAARGVTADQSRERILQLIQIPGGLARLINESKLGAEKFMELNKPQLTTTDLGGKVLSRTFAPLTGELKIIGTETKTLAPGEAERLKLEGERIGLEGRRVAVLEENQRRDSDPEFQQRMEAARTVGRKAAEGDIAAQRALPKAITRAEEGIRLVNELIGERDEKGRLLKYASPHPGFESVVGATWTPGLRFVPGTDSAGFMARFDQIKGASFLEAFESLKGGGAITEKEGSKATEAINRMSIATNEREFVRAAMDLQDVMRKGVQRAQELAGRGAPSKPAAPTGGVDMNNPLLK